MLDKSFEHLYLIFRTKYYKKVLQDTSLKDNGLNTTENFYAEIIFLLNHPTISEFANYLNISLPNANYKINSLAKKGYVKKIMSPDDRREIRLELTNKFTDYYGLNDEDNSMMLDKIKENFTEEEVNKLDEMINKIIKLIE
ncbi:MULTISPECIES: MarR family transcriptional regulator [Clostridium]|uniref:DNA-binding transcriptional regulator, MarR family n=1 Tax=Clostridium cadaveris TaxID=1529 RepID=A0A1I2PJV0_9CLOT|nr:MarR family transcriptional regulator [Clostridium cadaveris]MDU4953081.1 MarR family transcriptional regulator [Clostridium sp.]MDM8311679.1 MarR family transcriptional regulator [Clostridium cadaveris]MDY4947769.1 MarR family transcriptional regulator [Clostridium cadaveris]NME64310.1 MarR family transcriptional regulator [Clostridium cadaveris]NWK11079.1 MarR family transcriptional regulator [Clostridium cadaveris]